MTFSASAIAFKHPRPRSCYRTGPGWSRPPLAASAGARAAAPSAPTWLWLRLRIKQNHAISNLAISKASACVTESSLDFGSLPDFRQGALLKTPNPTASKLGNNFAEHETAIHTCSQCSHILQKQLESTPALHRILHRCCPCITQIIASKPQLGQDRVDLQRLRDRIGTLVPDVVAMEGEGGQDPY